MPVQSIFTPLKPQLRLIQRALGVHQRTGQALYTIATSETIHSPEIPPILVAEKQSQQSKVKPSENLPKSASKKSKSKAASSAQRRDQAQDNNGKRQLPDQETTSKSADEASPQTGPSKAAQRTKETKALSQQHAKKRGSVKSQKTNAKHQSASDGGSDKADQATTATPTGKIKIKSNLDLHWSFPFPTATSMTTIAFEQKYHYGVQSFLMYIDVLLS